VDGGDEVADVSDTMFHDTAELHAALCSCPPTSDHPLDHIPSEKPDQSGSSNRKREQEKEQSTYGSIVRY